MTEFSKRDFLKMLPVLGAGVLVACNTKIQNIENALTPTTTSTLTPDVATPISEITVTPEFQRTYEVVGPTDTIDIVYNEVPVHIKITTDKEITGLQYPFVDIQKIGVNTVPEFKTRYNETAEQAIAHAVLYAEYQCWEKEHKGADFHLFFTKLKAHYDKGDDKNPSADWSDVEFNVKAVNLEKPVDKKYVAEVFRLDPRVNVHVFSINQSYHPGITTQPVEGAGAVGTSVNINENELSVYRGNYPTAAILEGRVLDFPVALQTSFALEYLSSNDTNLFRQLLDKNPYKRQIFQILTIDRPLPKDWRKNRFKYWLYVPGYYDSAIGITSKDKTIFP